MKKNSLHIKIWQYFLIFSLLILGFLWAFQVLFLNQFYRMSKTKDIAEVANALIRYKDNEDISEIIDEEAMNKSVCVEVVNEKASTLYASSYFGKGCVSGKEQNLEYKSEFIQSNKIRQTYELINPMFDNRTLVQAIRLDRETYAFINTSLDPIDGTVEILQTQLIYVTIIVLMLSFLIAYFISRHISEPIVQMNKAAKSLAAGKFNTTFKTDEDIKELNELATTLNYAKDELAKTDELRQDLMANVSHDLKTPLTMIKAYAEMSRDLHAKNKKKQKEDMDIIISEVDRLTILVNDILELSSMQSNINELQREEFDLIHLTEEIIHRYKVLQETENYQFKLNHQEKELMIYADKKKLEQVIYNLVNNAINYTGEDNRVIINIINEEKDILIEIKDTGKGIKESDLPYIWDKYYKNKKKHKRNLVGTGLGLSIVKNILEQHNYEYGVTSKKNQGSCFYFKIPKNLNNIEKETSKK